MRKRALSLRVRLPAFTIALALLLVGAGKAYSKYYATAWYKIPNAGNCSMGTLPSGCVAVPESGVVCTVNGNTWYTTSSCTSVYYQRP